MFFSGDSTTRKRVDLGGRSSKERDRKKLVEETKLERNRRHLLRQQNAAALTIQRFYRGRKAVEVARSIERERFLSRFGTTCHNVDRYSFGLGSNFLPQLLFFFNPMNFADVATLVEVCRLLRKYSQHNAGEIVNLFAGIDYSSNTSLVNFRVKKLSFACFQAIYEQRLKFREQLMVPNSFDFPTSVLFETLHVMMDSSLPWVCNIVSYLIQQNLFPMLRNIILALKELNIRGPVGDVSSLERVLAIAISHVGHTPCICPTVEPQRSFASQILTVPFLWSLFPKLKEIFSNPRVGQPYFHQMALYAKNHKGILPKDVSDDLPSFACLVDNLLEAAGIAFAHPEASDMAINFAATATYMLEALPPIRLLSKSTKQLNKTYDEDEMDVDDELPEKFLNSDLELQIYNALSPHFILQVINSMLGEYSIASESSSKGSVSRQAEIIGAACAFLHVIFTVLPLERSMTVLAYRTGLVSVLWKFIKGCNEKSTWSNVSQLSVYLPNDAPGWLLPLAAFCPVYKYMLTLVDNAEFYEQEKPLPLEDIRCLIVILRQALWQLLWVNQVPPPNFSKSSNISAMRNHRVDFLQHIVCVRASELLSQLQDWNNRRQFVSPSHFQADGVNDYFISQATTENTKANEILKLAPFLVPFTSRAQIFTSQLVSMRDSEIETHIGPNIHKLKVRRNQILEDAFDQLNSYTEEELRGTIRITFVDEFGVEEAGIDGGGIFKDFMENVTQAAFDVQYGLFKETTDHLLYPNPGSGMVHEMHLQYFHFLGTVLAKAMFEGILVDIPFATFFLSKLKQKHNYLNDLPSLDPELYRHLLFLKHYKGDLSRLELYFVIVNNEYGEQIEDELVTGGKEMRVTSENVIKFIHLVANYRLNFQIREQSTHFLKGFQQLIKKEWIDMFNAHELQLLISGSVDGLDIDDLRANTSYTGGYHAEHYNIEMFWEVIKCLSLENQRKFLKFVTGCSRGPLLGFKRLEPLFCIQRVAGAVTEETLNRLPTAATCMNLLKLPPYKSKEQMEQKIIYAINSAAGFDLS